MIVVCGRFGSFFDIAMIVTFGCSNLHVLVTGCYTDLIRASTTYAAMQTCHNFVFDAVLCRMTRC